jgi:methionyl-tRNA formyltransferase
MSKAMKIIFAGTPEFAASALQACIHSHHNIVAVLTQPDRPAGRGLKISYSPVKQLAVSAKIPIYQPQRMDDETIEQLRTLHSDVMLVIAYGLLLPKKVLNLPKLGCINIHASLLPKWRGAAPVQRAIIAGDQQTGISIMKIIEELDAGPVLQQFVCEIQSTDTGSSLHDRLAQMAANEIVAVLDNLQSGKLRANPQDNSQASYAKKLHKQEANINWHESASVIERKIRAFNSWPVAYTYFKAQRLRIWEAYLGSATVDEEPGAILSTSNKTIEVATGEGAINLTLVQLAGGKIIKAQDFINAHNFDNERFTTETITNNAKASA